MASNGQNEGLHYEGVLEKAGKRFFEGFRKRWFILDGKNLSYYKAPETTPENLLGIIDLTKVKAVVPFKMINNNAFQIITNTRTYTFTAATTQLMTEWISVLRQAMQLKSFTNKRASKSFRTPSVDDAGYEVVRSSRTSSEMSDQAYGDGNLYDQVTDQVTSPGNEDVTKNFPIATYEAVGSFKRPSPGGQNTDQGSYGLITVPAPVEQNIEAYGSIGPAINKNSSEDPPQVGTYGVIGGSDVQNPNIADMYSVVQKPRQSKAKDNETVQSMYDEVKSVDAKPPPKIIVAPMSIICESDDDDDDNEDKVGDSTFVEENSEEIQDPLPSPKGNSYAVDQIRLLLKELKKDESAESRQEKHVVQDQETTDNTVIPDTCERAFTKLKEFLNKLEND